MTDVKFPLLVISSEYSLAHTYIRTFIRYMHILHIFYYRDFGCSYIANCTVEGLFPNFLESLTVWVKGWEHLFLEMTK
jgi:hypothetical protein